MADIKARPLQADSQTTTGMCDESQCHVLGVQAILETCKTEAKAMDSVRLGATLDAQVADVQFVCQYVRSRESERQGQGETTSNSYSAITAWTHGEQQVNALCLRNNSLAPVGAAFRQSLLLLLSGSLLY